MPIIQKIVGTITEEFAAALNVPLPADNNIYLGASNISHMENSHPDDFSKYGGELSNILASPDYIGYRDSDGTFEFIKEFVADDKHVKVAVRMSNGNRLFARSIYVISNSKVKAYLAKGTIVSVQHS